MSRIVVFAFGVTSYLIGVSALVGWILCMLGFIPFQMGPVSYSTGMMASLLISFGLMGLFAVQHTIMARDKFKVRISKILPAAAERSLFVLATGIILWIALLFWPTNSTVVWQVNSAMVGNAIMGLGILAWAYLFLASFAINHFELFGLEQTFNFFRNKETPVVPFKERFMYKFDRHPIMTGALIGMWATPVMTVDHLSFSIFFSIYMVFGVSIEERDLIKQWGDSYLDYKKRVKSIVPVF